MSTESADAPTNGANQNGDETSTTLGQKAVTIFDEPEQIPSPTSHPIDPSHSPKLHRASISGKKMTGRPHVSHQSSSPTISRQISYLKLEDHLLPDPMTSPGEQPTPPLQKSSQDARILLSQVTDWLNDEKAKRGSRQNGYVEQSGIPRTTSEHDLSLDKLEKILNAFSTSAAPAPADIKPKKSISSSSLRRGSIAKAFKRSHLPPASSDTEWVGEDINVPHVEAQLDNSRTLAFTGGNAEFDDIEAAQQKDMKHWEQFKRDVVRLTHTLKIRGWRRIPIEKGTIVSVERLSGALTNAVYVVKPPKELPEPDENTASKLSLSRSKPMELLLRIYGPQADHLIDREVELNILARLARKKIGPRLLGYFTNGRFEEYLHAKTLEMKDLRIPDTSKQIAKRMRELHDGIELLPSEREAGPRAFINWDKCVARCEKVITWLDEQVQKEAQGQFTTARYTRRGFICGVEWPVFKKAYEKYRKLLIQDYGGEKALHKKMVFAHNDAQYGNLMRLEPPKDSPLLQPINQHRQLVVIDFEYAGPSTPGYEFANHFSEWCYNYHGTETWACNASYYPTVAEQRAFVRAYVMHRPQFAPGVSSTPKMEGREKTNISDFMLDARTPVGAPAMDYDEEERAREEKLERDIKSLLHETRLWRIANAAFWVSWGIVQAPIPELDDPPKKSKTEKIAAAFEAIKDHIHPHSDPLDANVKQHQKDAKEDRPEGRLQEQAHAEGSSDTDDEVEEFDYLAYAQDRAMLFWGDCLQMGIVKEDELPASLVKKVKIIKY